MTRLDYLKMDWWRVAVLATVTLALPFIEGVENPAGVNPFTMLSVLVSFGWFAFIVFMIIGPFEKKRSS